MISGTAPSFQSVDDIEDALRSGDVPVRSLHAIWEHRQPIVEHTRRRPASGSGALQIAWLQSGAHLARKFTKSALKKEEFLLVCDSATEILRQWPDANPEERTELLRVRMDYAEALMRLGFTRAARRELEPCLEPDFQPRLSRRLRVELLLQLGNIVREESHHAPSRAARLQTAEEARRFYVQALELEPDNLDALILSAAASLILGQAVPDLLEQARSQAVRILSLAAKLQDSDGPRVKTTWARAMAQTMLGQTDAAAESYGELKTMDGITTFDLAEARYRAQFLAEAIGKPREFFKPAFPPLQLIVFAGHLPDLPRTPDDRVRFPPEFFDRVRRELQAELQKGDARVGLVSAAAGADLLFVEALNARQGSYHVVLPWSKEEFLQTSVRPFETPGASPVWEPLFASAVANAATLRELGQDYEPGSDVGWSYATEVTAGLALHIARVARLDVQPMALWDGLPGRGAGGTQAFVEFWRQQIRQEPVILSLPPPRNVTNLRHGLQSSRCERPTMQQQVKSMLFADIVGYSKLTERVIPEFVETFLQRVSQLAAGSKHAPHSVNTWGDAVYAVFDFARDAGCFALELTRMIAESESDWLQKGLYWEEPAEDSNEKPIKRPLSIRIGLHTGPVFIHYDPIVRRLGFTGAHVNRAARIEPIAKPGEVYASEEFAAMAELEAEIRLRAEGAGNGADSAGIVCEYAGTMQLAKHYPGRYRIYRVLPKRTFVSEELARGAHEFYCAEARARGETPTENSALCSWDELPDNFKEANRAQVADIPNKLHILGYELAPNQGLRSASIAMTDAQVEELSVREHDRWMSDRQRHGWTYAPVRDNARKHHPLLVPWDQLSEPEKEKDRDTVRNMPRLIEKAGFRVRRL